MKKFKNDIFTRRQKVNNQEIIPSMTLKYLEQNVKNESKQHRKNFYNQKDSIHSTSLEDQGKLISIKNKCSQNLFQEINKTKILV